MLALIPLVGAPAGAAAPAPKPLASYCSPTGDVCFRVVVKNGGVRLGIATVARYFGRYMLCVLPPGGASGNGEADRARCGSFPIFRGSRVWYGSVRLRPTFPGGEPGSTG